MVTQGRVVQVLDWTIRVTVFCWAVLFISDCVLRGLYSEPNFGNIFTLPLGTSNSKFDCFNFILLTHLLIINGIIHWLTQTQCGSNLVSSQPIQSRHTNPSIPINTFLGSFSIPIPGPHYRLGWKVTLSLWLVSAVTCAAAFAISPPLLFSMVSFYIYGDANRFKDISMSFGRILAWNEYVSNTILPKVSPAVKDMATSSTLDSNSKHAVENQSSGRKFLGKKFITGVCRELFNALLTRDNLEHMQNTSSEEPQRRALIETHYQISLRDLVALFRYENSKMYNIKYESKKHDFDKRVEQQISALSSNAQAKNANPGDTQTKDVVLAMELGEEEDEKKGSIHSDAALLEHPDTLTTGYAGGDVGIVMDDNVVAGAPRVERRPSVLAAVEYLDRDKFYESLWMGYLQQNNFLKIVHSVFLVSHIVLFWVVYFGAMCVYNDDNASNNESQQWKLLIFWVVSYPCYAVFSIIVLFANYWLSKKMLSEETKWCHPIVFSSLNAGEITLDLPNAILQQQPQPPAQQPAANDRSNILNTRLYMSYTRNRVLMRMAYILSYYTTSHSVHLIISHRWLSQCILSMLYGATTEFGGVVFIDEAFVERLITNSGENRESDSTSGDTLLSLAAKDETGDYLDNYPLNEAQRAFLRQLGGTNLPPDMDLRPRSHEAFQDFTAQQTVLLLRLETVAKQYSKFLDRFQPETDCIELY